MCNCMCVCTCNDSVGPRNSSLWLSGSPRKIRVKKKKKKDFIVPCRYTCTHDHEPSPLLYHPVFFTRSTLHSLTLPEVLQCHKELLCLRVLSALLWIRRHWLLFPWRLADLICLSAVLIVTQVHIAWGIPLNLHILFREHIP